MGDRSRLDGFIRCEREEIIRECGFTARERAVFEARADGDSVVQTSMRLHMSETTVKRDSARVRAKIARAMHRRRPEAGQEREQTIG